MIQFYAYIRVDEVYVRFFFNRLYTISGEKFFVIVSKKNNTITFDMVKMNGRWKIVEPAPKWLKPFEHHLSEIIKENY